MERHVEDWVWGWSRCRDVPAPVTEPDGFRIDVGRAGHLVRFVLTGTGSVRHRAETLSSPGTWLKVCARREEVLPLLGPAWVVSEPEYLMSVALVPSGDVPAPDGYTVTATGTRGFHETVVYGSDGSRAAHGRFALHQRTAVVDQVETAPEHQRRGLGSLVMRTIGARAVDLGARTAVLAATVAGHGLYRSLGWSVDSEIVSARLSER